MSPEQARGLEVDECGNIYSFAMVMYEMNDGNLPFSGTTMSEIIAAILQTEPEPLSQHVAGVPAD